jgi:sugar phosphate permease
MEKDLGLIGNQFQTAVSLLFVTYVLSELPSNLVLRKFTPSRWIAFITTVNAPITLSRSRNLAHFWQSWGIIATLTGLTQNYAGLVACRLLLGAVEGGLFPGLTIYLTLFYTKREIAVKVGYLFVSSAIAGALGGLLSYCIGFMDGVAGQRGWRWIMILEGLPTVALGISTWFFLADDPEHAPYLSDQEKQLMIVRQKRQFGHTKSAQEFHKADVYLGLKDWKVWAFAAGQFCADTMLYGYSIFLPTIIKGFGNWNTAEVQALTIPCYVLGAVSYYIAAKLSDKQQRRGVYSVIFGLVSVLGYVLLISNGGKAVHYFGCFLVAIGLYVIVGLPLAWLPTNQPRYGKRTTATGLQLTAGNISGIMAPYVSPFSWRLLPSAASNDPS